MPSIPIPEVVPMDPVTRTRRTTRGAGVATVVLFLSLAGCGGGASSNTPSDAGSDSGSSDVCAALARFDNVFQTTVDAVSGNQGVSAVQGSLSSLKEQYILVDKELKKTDPKAAEDLATAMANLQDAASKVPPGTDPAKVSPVLKPKVDEVRTVVTEAETKESCPS
jgi:hypothetical protein